MLSNAYFLAKFGFDTAENEPSKVWRIPSSATGHTESAFADLETAEVRAERRGLPEPRGGARRDHEGEGPRVASRGGPADSWRGSAGSPNFANCKKAITSP